MLKSKNLIFLLLMGFSVLPVMSEELLPEFEFPKPPAFRVGISERPETRFVQAEQDKEVLKGEKKYARVDNSREAEIADYTYADLDLKRMSKEISQELDYDGQDMLSDLSLLWQGAAMQSETINFALYKLANPDADKPDEKSIKKVLTTIASMSTLVGAGIGNPVIAGTSLISGNVLGIMTQDTKALNYKYTRVNDADMIILIRKVEDLQQKTVDLYYDYMGAKKQLEFLSDLVNERKYKFEYAQNNNAQRELVVITDAYYRSSMDKLRTAKAEFFSKRAALEQFVGNETLLQFEKELVARERGEKIAVENSQQESEYNKTVENVEKYTENLTTNTQKENSDDYTTAESSEIPLAEFEQNKLNISENTTDIKTDKVTGLSSNLSQDEVSDKNKKSDKNHKKVKSEKKAKKVNTETKVKKKKINENLIFLHNKTKDTNVEAQGVQEGTEPLNADSQQTNVNVQNQQDKKINTFEFLPLDEIQPPQLNGGYSIHNDTYYGEYYGDNTVQF